ncbi:LysR family transcriptional regulator [Sandaracinus amylolyticus]|uniref:LysR family transcriptional regulator n=1 Tax=Sandaracinus amylolyticus TaxID=927083 RepID=UPI001F3B8997|nr:LysR family transcriptional regulator [Sandaracinus amylolyticus]UJR86544.1 Hypothetical protein I5071_86390 [Sandaracinus amylolyticus]
MSAPAELGALNLNLLPVLAALLEERSVSKAARRAGVSQSAMSHSLAKLRELLGDPLLVPAGRVMTTTPHGARLAAKLPALLRDLRDVVTPPTAFDPRTAERSFTIATFDYFEITTLRRMLAQLARDAPRVRLVIERFGAETPARLRAGEVDLALGSASSSFPSTGISRSTVHHEPFDVIARRDHPRIGRTLTLARFVELDHLLISLEGRAEGVVDRALRERGLRRNVALRVPHFSSAPLLVASTDLVCTVARNIAEHARETFGVRVMKPPIDLPQVEIVAYWPRLHDDDGASLWLRSLFGEGGLLQTKKPG